MSSASLAHAGDGSLGPMGKTDAGALGHANDDDVIIGEGTHDFGSGEDTNRRGVGTKGPHDKSAAAAAALRDTTNVSVQSIQRAPAPRYAKGQVGSDESGVSHQGASEATDNAGPQGHTRDPPFHGAHFASRDLHEHSQAPLMDGPSLVRSSIDTGEVARMSLTHGSKKQAHGHRSLAAYAGGMRHNQALGTAGGGPSSHLRNRSALSDAHTEIDKLLRGMQGELVSWRESYDSLRSMWISRFMSLAVQPSDAGADGADEAFAEPVSYMKPPAGVDGFSDFIAILEEYLEQSDGARVTLEEELGHAMDEADSIRGELVDARESEKDANQRVHAAQEEIDAAIDQKEELHQSLERSEEGLRASRAQILALEERAAARDAECSRLEAACAELNAQLVAARAEARNAIDAMGEKDVAVLHKDGTIESLRAEIKRTVAALNVQDERVKIQEAELAQKESTIKEMDNMMAADRLELGGLQAERNASRDELMRLRGDLKMSQAALSEAEDARATMATENGKLREEYMAYRSSEDSRKASYEQNSSLLADQRRMNAALEAKLNESSEALEAASRKHVADLRFAEEEASVRVAQVMARLSNEQTLRKANEDAMRSKFEEKIESLRKAHDDEMESLSKRSNEARETLIDDFRSRERELNAALRDARAEAERSSHDVVTLKDAAQNVALTVDDLKHRLQEEQIRADTACSESIALRGQVQKSNEQLRRQVSAHRRAMVEVRRDFNISLENASSKLKTSMHSRIDSIVDNNFRILMINESEDVFASPGSRQLGLQHGEQYILRGHEDGDADLLQSGVQNSIQPAHMIDDVIKNNVHPSDVELEEISFGERGERTVFADGHEITEVSRRNLQHEESNSLSESNVAMGSPFLQG